MTLTYRSLKLVRGDQELSFNVTPFSLIDGSWSDNGDQLAFGLLIRCETWAEVERTVAGIQKLLTQAAYANQYGTGDTTYVWTKTCDALSYVAEIGATWKGKAVLGGAVKVVKWLQSPDALSAWVEVSLGVDRLWSRVQPVPVIEETTGLTANGSGGVIITAGRAAYAKRMEWTSTTGLTARFFWNRPKSGTDQLNFIYTSANFRCYYNLASGYLSIQSNTGVSAGATVAIAEGVAEIVVRWSTAAMAVFVNGVKVVTYTGTVAWPTDPERYSLVSTHVNDGDQEFYSIQVWPAVLTDAEIAALAGWGMPEPELPFVITPSDGATPTPVQTTSAAWKLYNTPGVMPARMRALVQGYTASYDALDVGVHTSGVPKHATGGPTVKFECESGTLGANTASTVVFGTSGGSVARFTPANTSWAARTTIVVCANVAAVKPYKGRWRLMLNAKDNASAVQINSIRWQMKVAGQSINGYSDTYSLPSVGKQCLIEMGEIVIPPVAWPDGAVVSSGVEYSGSYVTVEVEAMNSTGSGGGTLDLDALYLAPADLEASVTATTWDISTQLLSLDFVSDPPAPSIIFDTWRTTEWGGAATWEGNMLEVPPSVHPDDGALLWLYVYRDTAYEARPQDTLFAWLFLTPTWS